jgi:hypothetical protein
MSGRALGFRVFSTFCPQFWGQKALTAALSISYFGTAPKKNHGLYPKKNNNLAI